MRILQLLLLASGLVASTPTLQETVGIPVPSSPRISPDGKRVAYVVQEADWKQNEFRSNIWVAAASSTGEPVQLTFTGKNNTAPEWSPDSSHLAFLSDRDGGKNQIYVIPLGGGEPVALTHVETGVNEFHWSPDGKTVAFSAAEVESKEMKERKERFGTFEVVEQDQSMVHLWTIGAASYGGAPQRLTEGRDFSVGSFSWSPDSDSIAFSATRDPALSSGASADIYTVRISERTATKLIQTRGPDTNPIWSPAGNLIAYQTANGDDQGHFYRTGRIAITNRTSAVPVTITDLFDDSPRILGWSSQGVLFEASNGTAAHLYAANDRVKQIRRISDPPDLILQSATFDRDFASTAFLCSYPNRPVEVCVSSLDKFGARPITSFSRHYEKFQSAKREVIEWKAKDGTRVEGVLIKPPGFTPSKKYPLLVVIHGGPRAVDRPDIRPDRYYPVERFAEKGAVVLRPNYRGSEGYGERFRSLNVRNLGLGDYDDILGGVDTLIAKGYIDRTKVGAMGWSQGGYISAFVSTYSDRFRAVSVGAGISDWLTYYIGTDIHPFTRQYLKATPWDDPEIYRRTSPITYINRAKTPTLLQHGDQDKRVPPSNAFELYRGLQDRGVPSRLVLYKGFGHGINKPKEQLAVLTQNWEWFLEWIWGEKSSRDSGASPVGLDQ